MSVTAADGAVIGVDRDEHGWTLNCTVCRYVMSDPDDMAYVEEMGDYHRGWHDAEYEREQARR